MNLLRLLLLMLLASLTSAQAARDIDPSDFARHNEFDTVQISPTGEYLAATVNGRDGKRSVVIIRLKDKRVTARSAFGSKFTPGPFRWVNDERLIIHLYRNLGFLDFPIDTGNIYAVNADGKRQAMIFGPAANALKSKRNFLAYASVMDTLDDDPRHVLISVNPIQAKHVDPLTFAYRLDVYTGKLNKLAIAPERGAELLADHKQVVRLAFVDSWEGRTRVLYRENAESEWAPLPSPRLNAERFDGRMPSGITIRPIQFHPDNRRVYVYFSLDDKPRGVGLLDLENNNLESLSHKNASDALDTLFNDDRELVAVRYEPELPDSEVIGKSPLARRLRGLIKAFKGMRIDITSRSRDGRYTLLKVSSDRIAGDYYLHDATTRKADFLLSARSWEDPKDLHSMQPVRIEARDGLELHGYLTRPDGEGPYPLVVLPHGGPYFVRDFWNYDPEVQMLAAAGYAVLQINFRGSGGYGEAFIKAGFRQWGGKMQQDLADATRWAIDKGIAKAGNACIYGGSYGGYAALMGAATDPDLYACAIGYAGVYDLNLMYEKGDIQWTGRGRDYLDQVLGKDEQDRARRSPVNLADRIKAPVLLIHGKKDLRVPFDHAKAMENALIKAGNPPETLYRKGEAHGFYDEANRREAYRRILDFLARHLNGAP